LGSEPRPLRYHPDLQPIEHQVTLRAAPPPSPWPIS
jgi:hypothetical protein